MALSVGTRWGLNPPSFPVIVMARNERIAALQRTVSWKTLDALRRPFDRIWGKRLATMLSSTARDVAAAFRAGASTEAAINESFEALPDLYSRLYDQVAETFGQRARTAALRALGQDQRQEFFEETQETRRWIKEQTGTRIVNVTGTTVRAVKRLVDLGVIEGLTTDQIARELAGSRIFGIPRAFRVARTEVVAASNAGNHFATVAVLPNERFVKVWLSSRDLRVRDTHISADGQKRDLDAPFELSGGRLRFPGDSTLGARASEIVHCRCTTTHEPKKRR